MGGKNRLLLEAIALAVDSISFAEEATSVVFILKNKDVQNYSRFKESIIASANEPRVAINTGTSKTEIRLKIYDLANRTPMEGVQFI